MGAGSRGTPQWCLFSDSVRLPYFTIATDATFVEDSLDLARRAAALHAALPDQVTKGKAAVKMCQEWSRKPLSSAEALLAEPSVASPKSLGASRRKGAAVRALRGRQPQ